MIFSSEYPPSFYSPRLPDSIGTVKLIHALKSYERQTAEMRILHFCPSSAMGAAYGTAKAGIGITGMGTQRPELIMKVCPGKALPFIKMVAT